MRLLLCCCSLVLFLQILSWVPSTSRLLSPHNHLSHHRLGIAGSPKNSHSPYTLVQGKVEETLKAERYREIGSRPPDCEHKCDGCIPCVATIQVPIITSNFALLYSNYEPESWKCKCGPSFYAP